MTDCLDKEEDSRHRTRDAAASGVRKSGYRARKRAARENPCVLCGNTLPMMWACRCGFIMCQTCMDENFWGLSCNGITWVCPDCGEQNGFGNQ